MNTTIVDVVARAVRLALDLSWSDDFSRWARAWLDETDRSARSARVARIKVVQWADWGGDSFAARCVCLASEAAEDLDRSHSWTEKTAAKSIWCGERSLEGKHLDDYRPGPKLVLDDWVRGPDGRRGRSYDPREV